MPNSGKLIGADPAPIKGVDYEAPQKGVLSANGPYAMPKTDDLSDVNWLEGTNAIPENGLYTSPNGGDPVRVSTVYRNSSGEFTAIKKLPMNGELDYEIVAYPSNHGGDEIISRIYKKDLSSVTWEIPVPSTDPDAIISLNRNTSISRDGSLVAFGTPRCHLVFPVFNYNSWEWVGNPPVGHEFPSTGSYYSYAIFSPIEDFLVFMFDFSVAVYDTNTWNLIYFGDNETWGVTNLYVGKPTWSPDGTKLFYITGSSIIRYLDFTNPTSPTSHTVNDNSYTTRAIAHTDTHLLALAIGNPSIRAWPLNNYSVEPTTIAVGEIPTNTKMSCTLSPDGKYFAFGVNTKADLPIMVYDTSTWTRVYLELPDVSEDVQAMQGGLCFSPDNKYLYGATTIGLGDQGIIYKWSTEDWSLTGSYIDTNSTGFGNDSLMVLPKITTPLPPEPGLWIDVTSDSYWAGITQTPFGEAYEYQDGVWVKPSVDIYNNIESGLQVSGSWAEGLKPVTIRMLLDAGPDPEGAGGPVASMDIMVQVWNTNGDVIAYYDWITVEYGVEYSISMDVYDTAHDIDYILVVSNIRNVGPIIKKVEYKLS